MENRKLNLHMDQKRALFIMLSFSLMLIFVGVITTLSVGKDFSQLSSLLQSDYAYSANINDEVLQDDYYQFDAGISFSTSIEAQTSLNAEVLMQPDNVEYTELVDWNADELDSDAVAVTRGLARSNGLKIGDILYSKHIVDGGINAYKVEQILPDISSITAINEKSFTDGVIIMGYDNRYVNSLNHSNIFFTKTPVEELSSSQLNMPLNIVYRTEEITAVTLKMVPYLLVFLLMSISIIYGLMTVSYREVKYNIKRMIMLGFEKKELDSSFRNMICTIGFSVIIVAFIFTTIAAIISGFSLAEGVYILLLLCVESITVLAAVFAFTRRLWR